jgi:hypothetical protein
VLLGYHILHTLMVDADGAGKPKRSEYVKPMAAHTSARGTLVWK